MINLVGAGLNLASEVFKYLNSKESKKYLDKSVKLQQAIRLEEEKGYDAIDSKIESLLREYDIILGAARSELEIHRASDSS